VGRAASASVDVHLDGASATLIGQPGDYLRRPGFQHGGAGIAACWYGASTRMADHLLQACRRHAEPHAMAHLGAVDAALAAGDAMMTWITQVPGVLNVVASHFTRTGGWEAPVTIEQADGNGFITGGGVAAHGSDFTVVWKQIVGSSFNAYRNTYNTASKAWGVATLLSSGDTDVYFGEPNIFGDRHGNALVGWSEGGDSEDNPTVAFARFDALTKNPDILVELVSARRTGQLIVGFAAETGDETTSVLDYGRAKLRRKGCDLLVLNAVGDGKAFEVEDNAGWLLAADGTETPIPFGSKAQLGAAVWDAVRVLAEP
jgi:hypothetical protein